MKLYRIVFLVCIIISCSKGIKYDVNKWNDESDRGFFHNRNAMMEDLINHHDLKGKSVKELEQFFGYIDYDSTRNQRRISFEVYQEWSGIDPSYTKYLVLRLDRNKRVDSVFIEEYNR